MTWFDKCFRQGFQNLGGPKLATFDARRFAASWQERGAELVYMDAIHQVDVLFDTELSTLSPHLQGRDLVREFTDACAELGIRSGAYITPFEHFNLIKDHPDWCQTQTDGSMHEPWNGLSPYWACWNSPFLDRMCALIGDLYSRYPLEAAFFDGLLSRHGVCHCLSCTEKFTADTGYKLPDAHNLEDPAFRAYMRWKDLSLAEACRRIVAATRVTNPDVQVVSNTPAAWCNWCAVQPVEFFDATEFACVEAFPGFSEPDAPGLVHMSGVGVMAYDLAYTRGQSRGHPKVQAYNYTGSTNFSIDRDVVLEAKATIAQGGLQCVQGYRPALKEAFDHIRRCEPYLVDTGPVLWSALAASQESCNTQFVDETVHGSYFEDIRGSFAAMLDNKLPVEFVSGRDLAEDGLAPYAVLMLSDVGYMTDAQADAVRAFVRDGGGLVATARTSLVGIDGKPRADFLLADLLGVHAAPMPEWKGVSAWRQNDISACLQFDAAPWWGDAVQAAAHPDAGSAYAAKQPWVSGNTAHILQSPFQAVTAADDAAVLAWVRPTADDTDERLPGIVEHRVGKGRVLYISPRLGEIYSRYPFPVWRRLIDHAVRRAASRPPEVEVQAPKCVTVYAWEQPAENRWIIHLINDLDATGRPRGRVAHGANACYGSNPREGTVPVAGIELTVRKPGATRAGLPLENKMLETVCEDGTLRIRLPRLEQHALLVVE